MSKQQVVLKIPTLDFELNTQVRSFREYKGFSQEEFAFLAGRSLEDIRDYEDLTTITSYDFRFINRYARILDKTPRDFVFIKSYSEAKIELVISKTVTDLATVYRGVKMHGTQKIELEPFQIPLVNHYEFTKAEEKQIEKILDSLLLNGYFKDGVTGYDLYIHLIYLNEKNSIELPATFRPAVLLSVVITLSGRRKKPKLMPQRFAPRTPEKWILYKEDA